MAAVDDRDGTDRPADVADLTRALSKLNPSAEEFVPSSRRPAATRLSADAPAFVASMRLFGMMIDGDDGSSCNHQPRSVTASSLFCTSLLRSCLDAGNRMGSGFCLLFLAIGADLNEIESLTLGFCFAQRKYNYNQRPRKVNDRVHGAPKEDCIRRTVSEEQLAALFGNCGKIARKINALAALNCSGVVLGACPISPSKTPVRSSLPTDKTIMR
ncbi:hypothetical protein BHE74_00035316 [Ensete ventricosum]|uniref:Uncharacterized protein n=1 Tax=Ensete ventricosum TaxID=4639 RepID=A0A444G0Z3_ENSVE|nr:hypothetical protein B296_00028069 [Ensete ventricosum]RWW28517.1 hypothetical protein GW17_00006998 [Ensete ventricosum]RWW57864.1 hypothetical protein BHE74_00035316 [Ensete ventricosum]